MRAFPLVLVVSVPLSYELRTCQLTAPAVRRQIVAQTAASSKASGEFTFPRGARLHIQSLCAWASHWSLRHYLHGSQPPQQNLLRLSASCAPSPKTTGRKIQRDDPGLGLASCRLSRLGEAVIVAAGDGRCHGPLPQGFEAGTSAHGLCRAPFCPGMYVRNSLTDLADAMWVTGTD